MLDLTLLDLELRFGDYLLPGLGLLLLLGLGLLPLGLLVLRIWTRAQAADLVLKGLGVTPRLLLLLGGLALLLLLLGLGLGLGLGLAL